MLISFGLGNDWKFELDLVKYKHVSSFVIFDHSQSLIQYSKDFFKRFNPRSFQLKALAYRLLLVFRYFKDFIVSNNVHVHKKITNLGNTNTSLCRGNEINVSQVFAAYNRDLNKKVILKVDIEGYEYEIIDQIMEFKNSIPLLLIEFHDILLKKDEFKICLEKIKLNYTLIHTHMNNYGSLENEDIPQMCEFTFIIRSLYEGKIKVLNLPRIGLDAPTTPFRDDLALNFSVK